MEKLLLPKLHRHVIPCDVKIKIKDNPFVLITSDLRNSLVESFWLKFIRGQSTHSFQRFVSQYLAYFIIVYGMEYDVFIFMRLNYDWYLFVLSRLRWNHLSVCFWTLFFVCLIFSKYSLFCKVDDSSSGCQIYSIICTFHFHQIIWIHCCCHDIFSIHCEIWMKYKLSEVNVFKRIKEEFVSFSSPSGDLFLKVCIYARNKARVLVFVAE